MMILDDFFWRAVIAGMGVAILAGPLGCFVIWRRMSYLGDTMAHSALLGVAVGVFLEVNLILGVFAVAIAVALLLFLSLKNKKNHCYSDGNNKNTENQINFQKNTKCDSQQS